MTSRLTYYRGHTCDGYTFHPSYILLASLVTLSLFIGAVTLGMAESMEEVPQLYLL